MPFTRTVAFPLDATQLSHTYPVALNCLLTFGFESMSTRVVVHSIAGCAFYGAYTAKMLGLRLRGLPRWAVPVLGGTVLVEYVFNYPGLSGLLVDAVNARDYPEVEGVVLVISVLFVALNLAMDLIFAVLDPRVRRA